MTELNNEKLKRVVLFGAGAAGKNAFQYYKDRHQLIAFVDNNSSLEGTDCCSLSVLSPQQLKELQFDEIYIASTYYQPIFNQLTDHLGIDPDRVKQVDKSILTGQKLEYRVGPLLISALLVFSIFTWLIYRHIS